MDYYRKFCADMTAIMVEMNRSSGKTADGMVPVDARLFGEAVRIVGKARDSFNHLMEFKTGEAMRDLQNRYKLAEGPPKPAAAKPKPKPPAKKAAPAAKAPEKEDATKAA